MPGCRIFVFPYRKYMHHEVIVIEVDDIPTEKTIADDAIYGYAVYIREDLIIVHMKIKAVCFESGQLQLGIVKKGDFTQPAYALDGFV